MADEGGNLGHFVVGRVVSAEPHPNADRLQLCQVDVGNPDPQQIVCGAWNFGAGATVAVGLPGALLPGFPGPLDGTAAARRGLARDDPRRGRDRPRHRPRRDHVAPRRARAGDAAGRRAAARRPGARRDADDEPTRPALAGRARPRGGGALRRRAPAARSAPTRRRPGPSRWTFASRTSAAARATSDGSSANVARRPVAAVASRAAPPGRDALDLERRRRDELRDARLGQPAPRLRPVEAGGRPDRRPPRGRGGDPADARRHAARAAPVRSADHRRRAGRRARGDHGRPRLRGRRRRRARCCSRRRTSSRSAC